MIPDIVLRKPKGNAPRAVGHSSTQSFDEPGSTHLLATAHRYATEQRFVQAGCELSVDEGTHTSFYVVLDGWLMHQVLLEDGRRQVLDFALPGELILPDPETGADTEQCTEAITDSVVAVIPRDVVPDMMRDAPETALHLLDATRNALNGAYESLVDTGRRTSLEAVAHFLLRIEERAAVAYGRAEDGKVPFPLIQEHIGDAIGLTAVHVCRTLRKLKAADTIATGRGFLQVKDHLALAAAAGVGHCGKYLSAGPTYRLAS